MPGKISNKLLIAGSLLIVVAGIAIYLITTDRGRKKEDGFIKETAETQKDSLVLSEMYAASYDLESPSDLENFSAAGVWSASSGKNSCWLNAKTEYSVTIKKNLASIKDYKNIKEVVFSFSANSKSPVKNAVAVMSVDGPDGKSTQWIGKPIVFEPGSWQRAEFSFEINSAKLIGDGSIKLYVWNKSGEDFFIDDFQFKINGLVSSRLISSANIPERNIEYDFEVPFEGENPDSYSTENPHSGKRCYLLSSAATYSPSVTKKVSEVIDSELKLVTMSMWLNQQTDDNEVMLVATMKDASGKEYFWQGKSSDRGKFPKGEWVKHRAQFKLPFDKISPDDYISVYAWNKGGKDVFVDDFLVVFGETNVRSGRVPLMDMTSVGEQGFVFARNKPPYPTKYIQVLKQLNTDSAGQAASGLFADRILPGDGMCSGKFIAGQSAREQLVRLSEGSIYVYDYCTSENRMNCVAKINNAAFKKFRSDVAMAAGNFTGVGAHEVVLADINSQQIAVVGLEGIKEGCLKADPLVSCKIIQQLSKEQFSTLLPGKYTNAVAGDFNGDKIIELLVLDSKTGGFSLLGFKNNSIEQIAHAMESDAFKVAGFNPGGAVNVFRTTGSDREVIVLSWTENGNNRSKVLAYKAGAEPFSAITSLTTTMIPGGSHLYRGNFTGQGDQVIVLNRSRKFDFTMGGADQQGLFIDSRVEFAGFTPGYNPKFYEEVKIISGRFIDDGRTGLLVIAANCNDNGFPASPCKNYETASAWKPVSQLYYFKD